MDFTLKSLFLSGFISLLAPLALPSSLFADGAYKAGEDGKGPRGAILAGTAVFKGKVPPPRPFGLIVYPDIELCRRISDGQGRRLIPDFTVDPAGGFQNVVITIEGVSGGKAFIPGA
ncbi:MAG TPA: hypothetical protein VLB09_06130, partial [Nitrospiria bacterium]|nr:hypothetical protein [Nitrospiria bacterium]